MEAWRCTMRLWLPTKTCSSTFSPGTSSSGAISDIYHEWPSPWVSRATRWRTPASWLSQALSPSSCLMLTQLNGLKEWQTNRLSSSGGPSSNIFSNGRRSSLTLSTTTTFPRLTSWCLMTPPWSQTPTRKRSPSETTCYR